MRLARLELHCPGDEEPCTARIVVELYDERAQTGLVADIVQALERAAGWHEGHCDKHRSWR